MKPSCDDHICLMQRHKDSFTTTGEKNQSITSHLIVKMWLSN